MKFHPDSDRLELVKAAKKYQKIWDNESRKIVGVMEKISSLKFKEKFINALIYEGISFSHPLRLRASYSTEIKKATLIHELCHRLLVGNKIETPKISKDEDESLEIHKVIYLILYDIWVDLYGERFAKRNVKVEFGRDPKYRKAWDWALSFNKKTRVRKFSQLLRPFLTAQRRTNPVAGEVD